jgi:hypothetical protein
MAITLLALSSEAGAKNTVTSQKMSFENCKLTIKKMSVDLGVAPVVANQTSEMLFVYFTTAEGRTSVTCSKPDEKIIIARQTYL